MQDDKYHISLRPAETHGTLVSDFQEHKVEMSFIGLSPESAFTNESPLRAIILWATSYSKQILIVEGSFLTRWNLRALENLSAKDARSEAARQFSAFSDRTRGIIKELNLERRVSIFDWPAEIDTARYKTFERGIKEYSRKHPLFSRAILREVSAYANRKYRQNAALLTPYALHLLQRYMVEELSVFLYLHANGYKVEVYPGHDLGLMQKIAKSTFANFPVQCSDRTHISITLAPERDRANPASQNSKRVTSRRSPQ